VPKIFAQPTSQSKIRVVLARRIFSDIKAFEFGHDELVQRLTLTQPASGGFHLGTKKMGRSE
jgi:hypothetical protein